MISTKESLDSHSLSHLNNKLGTLLVEHFPTLCSILSHNFWQRAKEFYHLVKMILVLANVASTLGLEEESVGQ